MKYLVSALLFLVTHVINAQQIPVDDAGKATYTAVVQAPGFSADQLFENAIKWISEDYKSSKTITLQDKSKGIIKGVGIVKCFKANGKTLGGTHYTFTIMVKDGRYKYTFTDFSHKDYSKSVGSGGEIALEEPSCGLKKLNKNDWAQIKGQTDKGIQKKVLSLIEAMDYKEVKKSDNW